MGTTGRFDTEKEISKLTVDRRKFIEWAIVDQPDLFVPTAELKGDLIESGEFILEAQTILDTYNEIQSFLVMETVDESYVDPQDCVMSYISEDI